jgi:hypothetical protein
MLNQTRWIISCSHAGIIRLSVRLLDRSNHACCVFTGPVIYFLCLLEESIRLHQDTDRLNQRPSLPLASPSHLLSSLSLSLSLSHTHTYPHPSNNIPLRPSTQPRLRTSIATKQPHLDPLSHIILLPPTPTINLIIDHLSHRIDTTTPIQRIRFLGALVAVDIEIKAVSAIPVLDLVADVAALVGEVGELAGRADEVGAHGGDGEGGERGVEVGARGLDVAGCVARGRIGERVGG